MTQSSMVYDNIPPLPDAMPSFASPQPGRAPAGDGIPRFEVVAVRCADGTYAQVEYVTILTPGDSKASPRHKVTDGIRRKYGQHYDQWRRGLEMSPMGTPLEAWPVLTSSQVHILKAINIFTVEQLRDCPDSNLHQIPMGRTLKNGAATWLKTKGDADAIDRSEREKQALIEQNRLLAEQNAAVMARLAKVEEAQGIEAVGPEPAEPKTGPARQPRK